MMIYWQTSPLHFPDPVSRSKVAAFSKVLRTSMSYAASIDSMVSSPGTWMSYREFFSGPLKKPIERRGVTEPSTVSTKLIMGNFQSTPNVEHAHNSLPLFPVSYGAGLTFAFILDILSVMWMDLEGHGLHNFGIQQLTNYYGHLDSASEGSSDTGAYLLPGNIPDAERFL